MLTGDAVVLDLPFELDVASVAKQIKLRNNAEAVEEAAARLIEMVKGVARPRGLYRRVRPVLGDDSTFKIDGIPFTSRVLSKVLDNEHDVFPYLVTIGPELDSLDVSHSDMLERYRLDAVKSMVLHSAGRAFAAHLAEKYPGGRLTHINPGEIDDWPLEQQRPLFSLLGGAEVLGVSLTEGGMMKPVKSRSGLFFYNDDGFETCRLCRQMRCSGRRAAYDPAVAAKYLA